MSLLWLFVQDSNIQKKKKEIVSPIPEPVTATDIASSSLNTFVADPTPVPVPVAAAPVVAPIAAPVVAPAPIAAAAPVSSIIASETTPATVRSVAPTTSQDTVSRDPVVVPTPVKKASVTEVKTNNNDAELKLALEKIKLLEQQLAEAQTESVRARSNGRKLAATVQPLDAVHQHLAALEKPSPVEGYPPQVVLAVAALVFIFTYIFF